MPIDRYDLQKVTEQFRQLGGARITAKSSGVISGGEVVRFEDPKTNACYDVSMLDGRVVSASLRAACEKFHLDFSSFAGCKY